MHFKDTGPGFIAKKEKHFFTFDKILIITAFLIVFIFLTVGIIYTIKNKNKDESKSAVLNSSENSVVNYNKEKSKETLDYTLLGELRIITAENDGEEKNAIVVVKPWFSYPAGDEAFFEELSDKNLLLKKVFTDYFSLHSIQKLKSMGEDAVKDELIDIINKELSLGKISSLFFDTYAFIF